MLTDAQVVAATRKSQAEYALTRGKLIRLITDQQFVRHEDEGGGSFPRVASSRGRPEDTVDILDDDANLPADAEHSMDPRQMDVNLPQAGLWTEQRMQE